MFSTLVYRNHFVPREISWMFSGSDSSIEFAMKLARKIAPRRGIAPGINHLSSSILIKDHFPDLFFSDIPCLQNKTSIQGAVVMYTCFIRVLFPSFNIIFIYLLACWFFDTPLPRISLATASLSEVNSHLFNKEQKHTPLRKECCFFINISVSIICYNEVG